MSDMGTEVSVSVKEYVENFYQNGLIGISDIASYCKMTEGKLYTVLLSMQRKKELKIIKRYFCPEFHPISVEYERSYCQECDLSYSNEQIEVAIYVQPLHINS